MILMLWLFLMTFFVYADDYSVLKKNFLSARKPMVLNDGAGIITEIREVSDSDACILSAWDNQIEPACACCMVQESDKITDTKISGQKIIHICLNKKECTEDAILSLRSSEGYSDKPDDDFVAAVYDKYKIIKRVHVSPQETYRGKFFEEGLRSFLARAYRTGKIVDSAFEHVEELEIRNLHPMGKKSEEGGMATKQLFLVKNLRTGYEYIIKDLAKGKHEAFNVALAARYNPLKKYSAPANVPDFPVLALPVATLEYYRWRRKHIITITPKASGSDLYSYMNAYKDNPSDSNKMRLQKAYIASAKTLANFHKAFMKNPQRRSDSSSLLGLTLVHGDLHPKNIFYDDVSDRVYWIDLDRLGKSILRPVSPAIDLGYILLFPFFGFPWNLIFETNIRTKKIDIPQWFNDFYKPFIRAYITAFGSETARYAREVKHLLHLKKEGMWHNRAISLMRYFDPILDTMS
ncbi:MAG: hypothetical protein K2X90_00375 [Candidatus Babeliaceae bacterium]|nr:hypothetical protein [Candidatus Babeliaceae bacterium]